MEAIDSLEIDLLPKKTVFLGIKHKLNMKLDLQSLFGLHVHSFTHWLGPRDPLPLHLVSYTKALLVSQDRRHLFVTPWYKTRVPEHKAEDRQNRAHFLDS